MSCYATSKLYLLVILICLKPDKLKQSSGHYFSDSFKKNVFGVENLLWEFAFKYFPFQKGVSIIQLNLSYQKLIQEFWGHEIL